MAIVPDLSGTRPGRPGNIPLFDPRNRSNAERAFNDDNYNKQTNITLVANNQLVALAKETRNMLLLITPENAATVYVSMNPLTAANGIPVSGGIGLQLKGKSAEQTYYCWGVAGVVLSVLEG